MVSAPSPFFLLRVNLAHVCVVEGLSLLPAPLLLTFLLAAASLVLFPRCPIRDTRQAAWHGTKRAEKKRRCWRAPYVDKFDDNHTVQRVLVNYCILLLFYDGGDCCWLVDGSYNSGCDS